MPPTKVGDRLLTWASDMDYGTIEQARKTAALPFIAGHVALMPDAHVGIGATVGSVIPTKGAIVPAAVGVDIGCGMIATRTNLTSHDLPESLQALMPLIERTIPAGVGKGHNTDHVSGRDYVRYDAIGKPQTELTEKQRSTAESQFGTLGSGNHFVEVCIDENDGIWTVLHSGSRGIGNQLAQKHISDAKASMKALFIPLEDPNLAYFVQSQPQFGHYIRDMLWAQRYAAASREVMNEAALRALFEVVGHGQVQTRINCHHNFSQQESHHGEKVWITRKGAIKADTGDLGVIPGSMGTGTFIVQGKGNPSSFNSCSHGAGRRMSRSQAKRELTVDSLREAMGDRVWNDAKADSLVDEHPEAYKDINTVMADQSDLVEVVHTLRQILNYKGT